MSDLALDIFYFVYATGAVMTALVVFGVIQMKLAIKDYKVKVCSSCMTPVIIQAVSPEEASFIYRMNFKSTYDAFRATHWGKPINSLVVYWGDGFDDKFKLFEIKEYESEDVVYEFSP